MEAGKVRRSIQMFYDYSRDLSNADMNTFNDRLSLLISFFKTDDFFSKIDKQLIDNPRADFDLWFNTVSTSDNRGRLSFPTDIDERLSVMYELLCRINEKKIDMIGFCGNNFIVGSNRIDDYICAFNEVVSQPLFRELAYRLEGIQDDLPPDTSVGLSSPMIQIIHKAQKVIQQNAFGNNNHQSAEINNSNDELPQLFNELRNEISSLNLPSNEMLESIETIDSCEELLDSERPKLNTVKKLLGLLPPMGNVASITSAIITLIRALG